MLKVISLTAVLLACAGGAAAQVGPGDNLFTLTGGYGFGKSKATGKSIDGGAMSFSFDTLGGSQPLSLLFAFGFSSLESEEQRPGEVTKRSVASMPFYLGGKYWLGSNKVLTYLGAALGVYFSSVRTTTLSTSETYSTLQSSGWGMGVPLGVNLALTDSAFLTGGMTLNWLWENEFLENDLLYSVNLGLAFKMGG